MKNYAETKKELDRIRNEYGCKGEMIFRTALQYVVEYGQSKFKNNKWVQEQLMLVDGKHDEAELEGKTLWIGREFEKSLIECAAEIANVDTYGMLVYIQKEVWLSHEGGIDYQRAIELLKDCMDDIEQREHCEDKLTLCAFEDLGFDHEELITLNFGYLLNVMEDEEDDA